MTERISVKLMPDSFGSLFALLYVHAGSLRSWPCLDSAMAIHARSALAQFHDQKTKVGARALSH